MKLKVSIIKLDSYLLVCIAAILLSISACSEEENSKEASEPFESTEVYDADTIIVDNEFPPFASEVIPEALDALGFCTLNDSLVSDSLSYCSSSIFRVFPLNTEGNFQDGFLLDTRIGALKGSNSKALIVVVNTNGKYEIQNFLKGKILERRTSRSGYYDILMQYRAEGLNKVAIKHVWNNKSLSFVPKQVEELNNYFIKAEAQDSINQVYLNNFVWGY